MRGQRGKTCRQTGIAGLGRTPVVRIEERLGQSVTNPAPRSIHEYR
jgi:hypothetical protein